MKGVLPVLLLATLVAISYSMKEIEVFRLYGFQKGGQVYGSKIASFSLVGAHYQGDVLRQVAIIRFQEITSQNIQQIISRRASGILIVLPQKNSVVENENEVWPIIYSNLINQTLYIPVFFTWENQDVNNLYNNEKERVTKNLQDLQEYKIAVTSEEPKLLPQVNYEDYFAYFEELNTYRTGISSILVVANYDTLTPSAVIPEKLKRRIVDNLNKFLIIKIKGFETRIWNPIVRVLIVPSFHEENRFYPKLIQLYQVKK